MEGGCGRGESGCGRLASGEEKQEGREAVEREQGGGKREMEVDCIREVSGEEREE